jgi:hypothetical protein
VGQSSLIREAILRSTYSKATSEGITLLAALEALMAARINENATGKILVGTAGNGHSVTFAPLAHLTPVEMIEGAVQLLRLYETAAAYLGGTPTEAQIYAEMKALNAAPANELYSDFTQLRTGGVPA